MWLSLLLAVWLKPLWLCSLCLWSDNVLSKGSDQGRETQKTRERDGLLASTRFQRFWLSVSIGSFFNYLRMEWREWKFNSFNWNLFILRSNDIVLESYRRCILVGYKTRASSVQIHAQNHVLLQTIPCSSIACRSMSTILHDFTDGTFISCCFVDTRIALIVIGFHLLLPISTVCSLDHRYRYSSFPSTLGIFDTYSLSSSLSRQSKFLFNTMSINGRSSGRSEQS